MLQPVKVGNRYCCTLVCKCATVCNSSPTIVTWSPQTRVRIGLQAAGATALPPPAWAAEMAFPMSHRETAEWPARSDKIKNKHVTAQPSQTIKCHATEEAAQIFYLLKKKKKTFLKIIYKHLFFAKWNFIITEAGQVKLLFI